MDRRGKVGFERLVALRGVPWERDFFAVIPVQKWGLVFGLGAFAVLGGGFIAAQSSKPDGTATSIPRTANKTMSLREMADQAAEDVGAMKRGFADMDARVSDSTTEADVIRLDCLNNALLRMKKLLNIAEDAQGALAKMAAAGTADAEQASFRYEKAKVAKELADEVVNEANGCAGGEELAYGAGKVESTGPGVIDNPLGDKKDASGFKATEPEDPGHGSPF